jgi:hypothetical protein
MIEQLNQTNFTQPDIFKQKLEELTNKLPGMLDDFKKAYLFYNKNPQNNEYHQIYETSKNVLNTFNTEVLLLSNNIESTTEDINKILLNLNKFIINEKQINKELKKKVNTVEHKESAANELIYDYKKIYGINYTKNWGLFLSILIGGFSIYKIYKNKI